MPAHKFDATDFAKHAEMLANRVGKAFRRLHPGFERRGIGAFRLYDWDIPEVRATVDWYEGHVVLSEYTRTQTEGTGWLDAMGVAVRATLDIPAANVHFKRTGAGRAKAPTARAQRLTVREGDLAFLVDLSDPFEVGLHPDGRSIRGFVRKASMGLDVLNLFGGTGSLTCAAAKGGAASTTTVDTSLRSLAWCRDNLALNDLSRSSNRQERADPRTFLDDIGAGDPDVEGRFDLIVMEPPVFVVRAAGVEASEAFDVQRDHPALIAEALGALREGGVLWFVTRAQRFEPRLEALRVSELKEMTDQTVPEEYRNLQVHRSWRIVR